MNEAQREKQKQFDEAMGRWASLLEECISNTVQSPLGANTSLDSIIAQCPDGRGKGLSAAFERQLPTLEGMLPDHLKNQAKRFVKVAMMTFSKKDELQKCTPSSFLWAVFEAASYGFAIDGRLFHAVSRRNPKKGCLEAQCMPDYKGLIAAGKRAGLIRHADAELICANDHFRHGKNGGENVLEHTYEINADRGPVIGAFARVWLPDGMWDYELMSLAELQKVADKSSYKAGPWTTDTGEMQKKTVLRRILKTFQDDPVMQGLLELDDREYQAAGPDPDAPLPKGTPIAPATPAGSIMDQLADSLPPAPGESFTEGSEAATEPTEFVQPTVASVAEPPVMSIDDEANLESLNSSLSQAQTAWEVDSIASDYVGVFQSEAVKERGREAVRAAKARCTPDVPPARSKGKPKQKSMVDTSPSYD